MHRHTQDEKRRLAEQEPRSLRDCDEDFELFLEEQAELAEIFGGHNAPCDEDEFPEGDDWPEPDASDFPD